ncbi:pyridoxamine 5'-phosphate oxidase family protein [Parafrankia discariae]|uniref:pyridoxamine 5'-phosphate oxidase family protein n=1 Tax=Parafrankia discariae TaxID=365528 RepID=UPI00035FFE8D|nr:pyridoxamine 5'-phosphate oxidase family protein [Parafrankia discariae]
MDVIPEVTEDGGGDVRAAPGPLAPVRARDRVGYDTARIRAVLDEALVCHVGLVVDGWPHVLPTLHTRREDTLYLHGSTASRLLAAGHGQGAAGRGGTLPVCVTVTLLDGLVLARSAFHHSVNYRSVMIRAAARLVSDDAERRAALDALVDRSAPGRSAACRPPNRRELAATAVLAVPLTGPDTQVAVKTRTGGPNDDPADLTLPHWAGVIPMRSVPGVPEADPALAPGILPPPAHPGSPR